MKYTKPFRTFDQQADLMIQRGMAADRHVLAQHLQDVGYYRLSGYSHIFKEDETTDKFIEGTTFDDVWNLYVFDRQLRLIVLDATERFEVYMRTQLAYRLSEETGPFGFKDPKNLPRLKKAGKNGSNTDAQTEQFTYTYKDLIRNCRKSYSRAKEHEKFAEHFSEKYGDDEDLPPYWILLNLVDFGTIQGFYCGASPHIRSRIASDLGVTATVLDSWLSSIRVIRNICAHHGRLWNRTLGVKPKIPNKQEAWHKPYEVKNDKLFGLLTILSYILERAAPDTHWRERLLDHIDKLESEFQAQMGFTAGWETCPLWEKHLSSKPKQTSVL